jgi:uncharacterized protein (TIGR03437 family)
MNLSARGVLQSARSIRTQGSRILQRLSFLLSAFLMAGVAHGEVARSGAAPQPISFERNQGQVDKRVKFVARAGSYQLFLTDRGAVMALDGQRHASLALRLLQANRAPNITALDQQRGVSNYLIGADPSKWVTDVNHYGKIRYERVYPGVDVVYYGKERQLEHDFIVAPGADYRKIRFDFEGARSLRLESNGDLAIQTSEGEVRQLRPSLYQEISGERKLVAGGYRIEGREVSFYVGAYDRSRPLIIDPIFNYFATYLGGSGINKPTSLAVDAQGNAYTTGSTTSLDFPTGNPAQPANGGMTDVFITKMDGTSGAILYSTYLGGNNDESANQIKVDASGNAYIIGTTFSTDFPATKGALQTTLKGPQNAFAAKLNPAGNALVYATYLGGSGGEIGRGIDLDSLGDAYVVGVTYSRDFPVHGTAFGFTPNPGIADGFLTEINPTGTASIYSGYMGGTGFDELESVAVNSLGEANVVGFTNSTDLPTTFEGSRWPRLTGVINGFMAKVSPGANGNVSIEYISYYGGSNVDIASSIIVDPSDDVTVYISGLTTSSNFPTANNQTIDFGANQAIPYVAKFALPGLVFVASRPGPTPASLAARAASLDDYTWFVPAPDDCKGSDWGPLLKSIQDDLNFLNKFNIIVNDLGNIVVDLFPNVVGVTKDTIILIKDASCNCNKSSNSNKSLPVTRSSNPQVLKAVAASPTPLFGVDAASGLPVTVPQPPTGAPTGFTSPYGLAVGPSGNIYVAMQTDDTTLPVSALGTKPGTGALNGYIVELSTTPPAPNLAAVVNGASFTPNAPVAPGSLISLFGTFDGSTTAEAGSTPLPVSLGATSVTINNLPTPLYYVNNSQINAQLPWETAPGPATAVVTSGGAVSSSVQFTVAAATPGIFTFGNNRAVAQNQDYSTNDTGSPAAVGSVITVYMTGGGAVSPPIPTGDATPLSPLSRVAVPFSATIGGQSADVEFLGMAPGLVGVVQADVKVPSLNPGDYPLIITVGGVQSNAPIVTVSTK